MSDDFYWNHSSVDPRVQVPARNTWRATSSGEAKISGSANSFTFSWARKRAYRRARGRAARAGGTWYRGERRSARSLGVDPLAATDSSNRVPTARHTNAASQGRQPRLRILSYNVGGMSADLFDVFTEWSDTQEIADIIVLQEIHHGMGKGVNTWSRGAWHFVATSDPANRYAGVCICISAKLAAAANLEQRVIIPGRLVHVRIQGYSLPVDVIGVYQWVKHSRNPDGNVANRSRLWTALGHLLAALPRRNVLALAGDLNASCCRLDVHVGSGVLQCSGPMDSELVDLLRTHDLCLLNTWSSARPNLSATFVNGRVRTQIDFVVTRRVITDPQARTARPLCLDLAPWRLGPKHRPVLGSIPWVGSWQLKRQRATRGFTYSLPDLRECHKVNPAKWESFCAAVTQAAQRQPAVTKVSHLNQVALHVRRRYFPVHGARQQTLAGKPELKTTIAHMWHTYHQWKHSQRSRTARGNVFKVWRHYAAFKAASKSLRRESIRVRRKHLHDLIGQATVAAARDQMSELYRITKALAPKQRRERAVIRAPDGQMLRPEQQFQAILQYFTNAFSDPTPFWFSPDVPAPDIQPEDLYQAITQLKPRKAVPANSAPPEVWKACPELFAQCLAADYAAGVSERPSKHSSVITHCSLALLPKPHNTSRLPKDLRPLGIQDPASKLIARVLRDRLCPQVQHLLHQAPQYAYIEGKSIDSAIIRVVRHCRVVRDRLKAGALSVHAKASGAKGSTCYGGIMIGLDLSRAFDCLTRAVLVKALQHAQVDESLQRVLLEIHCQCSYELQHQQRQGLFAMQKGVRQGCSVSPMLYSLFTVWMMAELKTRVSPEWVEHCMTCFADDTHLAWCVNRSEDLSEVCRTVREVFKLFRECGMVVNADKSSAVIQLRGSVAKRWLKANAVIRRGVKGLNFGLPGDPLVVPVVTQLTYLGIQASYGSFEVQTFKFRQQAASANRARLAKLLHSKQIAIRAERVCIWPACAAHLFSACMPLDSMRQ